MIIDDLLKFVNDYELFIFDINGVLDNNHNAKIQMLKSNFPEMSLDLIKSVNIDMERAYESNQSGGTATHISQALKDNQIQVDDVEAKRLADDYFNLNRVNPDLITFLNNLAETKKVCLYTALSRSKVEFITSLHPLSKKIMIFAREDQIESKPSIRNLKEILRLSDVTTDKAILFGDNVSVDIMPANLIGIKSILVSNYVDDVIKL
jgi:FMN phosphatase YigB (HAD superfamily)